MSKHHPWQDPLTPTERFRVHLCLLKGRAYYFWDTTFPMWAAKRVPRRIRRWCYVHVMAKACANTGKPPDQVTYPDGFAALDE